MAEYKNTERWHADDCKVLINIWGAQVDSMDGTVRDAEIYRNISAQLAERAIFRTPQQVRSKIKMLKQTYRQAKVRFQKGDASAKRSSIYYKEMDAVLGFRNPSTPMVNIDLSILTSGEKIQDGNEIHDGNGVHDDDVCSPNEILPTSSSGIVEALQLREEIDDVSESPVLKSSKSSEVAACYQKKQISDCKERWKNLRGRYLKYRVQKKLPFGHRGRPTKEYYLASHLRFLDNFLKSRKCSIMPTVGENAEESGDVYDDGEVEMDVRSSEDSSSFQNPIASQSLVPIRPKTRNSPPPPNEYDYEKRKTSTAMNNVNDRDVACNYFEQKPELTTHVQIETPDPDMSFLQSVLPDMKSMNDRQKRKFKIGVLNLIEQILEPGASDCAFIINASQI